MAAGLWEATSAGSVGFSSESPPTVADVAVAIGAVMVALEEVTVAVTVAVAVVVAAVVVAAAVATGVAEVVAVTFGVSGTMQVRDCRTRRLRRLVCNFLGVSMKGKSS